MGVIDKAIAEEIVTLEYMQSQGYDEYEVAEMVVHVRPIGPRLRELYKQLEETGKAPLSHYQEVDDEPADIQGT